jgi:hypothetical protein
MARQPNKPKRENNGRIYISKNLNIMNEESELSTFQNRRGSSNIDLSIVNNQLLTALKNWEISE